MIYEHFLYGDGGAVGELAAALQKSGFIVKVVEGESFLLVFSDYESLSLERPVIERKAQEFGCIYDGGGCYVGPLSSLD